ncbi:MAG: hypothetical protein HY049_06415 [Acidobacteria bacterium]|nr:hypothetical protein [Acidobacteriota bacterium]
MKTSSTRTALALAFLAAAAAGAGCGKKAEKAFPPASHGVNGSFTPASPATCARPDQLSLQPASTNGSVVNINLTATDCDASLLLNGVNFELGFDDTVLDFVGCSAAPILPANKLAPGTPACTVAAAGDLIGTVALELPSSFRVSGGVSALVRLTFSVKQKGVSSPINLLNTDSLSGTTLFFADPVTQFVTPYTLGGAGYAGGTIISN